MKIYNIRDLLIIERYNEKNECNLDNSLLYYEINK